MNSKCLTTKEVARLCRVSNATVKRWEQAGLIRSERTNGGHRRFRAEEIARFQQEQQLGLKRAPGDETVVTAKTRRPRNREFSDSDLFHSLISGQEEEVANLLINDFLNGKSITELFDENISPAMKRIGELWFEGKLSVAQEHLATRAVMCAIHKLRSVVPVADPCHKLALCCAPEGDFHELPTHLVQMTFESKGWEVLNFGANTPLYSIIDEVLQHTPQMICISSTFLSDIERISRDYREFIEKISNQKTAVILGGRAFDEEKIRPRFPADFYPANFSELAQIIGEN